MKKKIIIIGGGLGGLAAAVTLANAGLAVELYEKNEHFGGKLMPVRLGNHSFDFGPNTITMPEVFNSIIEQTGESAADYFNLIPLTTHTRNHFPDGQHLDFSSEPETMQEEINRLTPVDAANYSNFIDEISRIYSLSERYFFPSTFQSWRDYLSPSLGKALLQVRPAETMDHFYRRYFRNPQLLQAFGRYATYIGSSPYKAPATFSMIAYLELVGGVYYAKGGNASIAEGFASIARKNGALLHAGTAVKKIILKDGKAVGVELDDGKMSEADAVILNGDLLSAFPQLTAESERPSFSDKKSASFEPSISAFVILAGLNTRLSGLKHHNVYFSEDYRREFDNLFDEKCYSEQPTVYISNSSFTDPSVSPDGDNLFILVNAPALTADGKLQIDAEAYKNRIYDFLETYGLDIRSHLVEEKVFTSSFIADHFNAYRGSLYGPSSHKKKDAFLRPANASPDIKNLYFVGGSTHPGGGSPMVTMSGQNVAKRILKKYGFPPS
ncbi:phytoene desaturase family protein [Planococcus salinarum]|uniref:phytoene desaturase family protein n=1 Tax=Planococcus salinarum TaxID=622695 RepID=UPI001E326E33|nr:phytoene desaturase family protein [Planococcus salinarum]